VALIIRVNLFTSVRLLIRIFHLFLTLFDVMIFVGALVAAGSGQTFLPLALFSVAGIN